MNGGNLAENRPSPDFRIRQFLAERRQFGPMRSWLDSSGFAIPGSRLVLIDFEGIRTPPDLVQKICHFRDEFTIGRCFCWQM